MLKINSYDIERYWFGKYNSQDNMGENFAKYDGKFIFYSRGLDKQEIKNVFNPSEVKIHLTTNSGDIEEKIFKIDDIIKFK